jgi:plastocyanin
MIAVAMLLGALAACGNDVGADGDTTESAGAVNEGAAAATEEARESTDEGGAPADVGEPSTTELVIVDFGFEPDTLEVSAGATVEVVNEDAATHTVSAEDGSFDIRLAGGGDRASFTVDAPGTYPFVCTIHPSMTGSIVVR